MKLSTHIYNLMTLVAASFGMLLTGCMEWDYGKDEDFYIADEGLFITNEGNFQYGNATLSFYNPETKAIENEIFYRANAMKLGDVAQSMIIRDGIGWVVVNNSHVVFAIDIHTFKEVGRITNLTSPRYIHFISDEKAYVTQIWDNRIFIVNPKKYQITGYIECPNMTMESGSTEQMVQYGKYVYVNCWSYQNRILKIDTETNQVVDELEVVAGRLGDLICQRTSQRAAERTEPAKVVRAEMDEQFDDILTIAFVTSVAHPSPEATRFVSLMNAFIAESETAYKQRTVQRTRRKKD